MLAALPHIMLRWKLLLRVLLPWKVHILTDWLQATQPLRSLLLVTALLVALPAAPLCSMRSHVLAALARTLTHPTPWIHFL